jgi:hypothetical protein
VALLVVGVYVLAACDDQSEPRAASTSTTLGAGSASGASSTTVAPAARTPAQVAKDFLDAYRDFDADRALTYLTEDAIAKGAGDAGSWGSPEGFRLDVALTKAQHIEQMLTGCKVRGESAAGTTVRCGFDLHAFHSDEIGRGPYTDNYWDLVVRDGKVTSAASTWAYLTNGFSNEMWTPFQTWVASTHPLDIQLMYVGNAPAMTEESVRLWEQRTREYADAVNRGAA